MTVTVHVIEAHEMDLNLAQSVKVEKTAMVKNGSFN
jgi:hypothetical protein